MKRVVYFAILMGACAHSESPRVELPAFPVQSTVDTSTPAALSLSLWPGGARVESGGQSITLKRSAAAEVELDNELFAALRAQIEKLKDFNEVIALRVDRHTPYRELRSALYTAGQASVSRFLFEFAANGSVTRHRLFRVGTMARCRDEAAELEGAIECARVDARITESGAVTLTPKLASGDACVTASTDPRAPTPVTIDGAISPDMIQPLFADAVPCPGVVVGARDSVQWERVAEVIAAGLVAGERAAEAAGFEPNIYSGDPASTVFFTP